MKPYPDQVVLGVGDLCQCIEVEEDDGLSLPVAVRDSREGIVRHQVQLSMLSGLQGFHTNFKVRQHQPEQSKGSP